VPEVTLLKKSLKCLVVSRNFHNFAVEKNSKNIIKYEENTSISNILDTGNDRRTGASGD
jgi:hypothetical protein